ncbi:MAG: AAA family ATPase [Burkholderiales bacterium]
MPTPDAPPPLAVRLCESRGFPHAAERIDRIETHISWVVLAGDYAYKLKKPLDLGFLDFSSLEKRRAACEDEVRLNRRLAPELYLDVVAVTGTEESPRIGGEGPVLDYAVRMHRFDRAKELDRLLREGRLTDAHVDELARLVARFHAQVPAAVDADPWGTAEVALENALANFGHVRSLGPDPDVAERLAGLERWTRETHARLAPAMAARKRDGYVRECHGDLHLANAVLLGGRVVVFDCIEFNPALRWIDVMAEIAFTAMDLHYRGRADLARRFVNGYLEATGDYGGLAVLRFYLVYRAMVRAKIARIRVSQAADDGARARDRHSFVAHLALAEAFAAPAQRALVITCGPSGSGKSFVAARLATTGEWIRVRSDVERRRIAGARAGERSPADAYSAATSERTYARLAELARIVVSAGYPAIVDATFLSSTRRRAFADLARSLGVPFAILAPRTPVAVMRERIVAREAAGADPSEATIAVLEQQLAQFEPFADDETAAVVGVEAGGAIDAAALAAAVAARCAP